VDARRLGAVCDEPQRSLKRCKRLILCPLYGSLRRFSSYSIFFDYSGLLGKSLDPQDFENVANDEQTQLGGFRRIAILQTPDDRE
jgi:hypothetical protein